MGMSMFNAWAKDNKVPTFGYDANSDAVAAIAEGYGGTISQHADVQAYLTLRVLRNALDGVDVDTGIGTADEAGNCLTEGEDYRYSEYIWIKRFIRITQKYLKQLHQSDHRMKLSMFQ